MDRFILFASLFPIVKGRSATWPGTTARLDRPELIGKG